MKMVKINPEHSSGCAPACIATILGWKYDDVTKLFACDFSKEGITHEQSIQFIAYHGYDALTKEVMYHNHIDTRRPEMLKPFADVHFISTRPYVDSVDGHAIIMDKKGNIFDPHKPEWRIETFYEILKVTGLWKV